MTIAQKLAKYMNDELRFPPTLCNKALDVLREHIQQVAWDIEEHCGEFYEEADW